MPSYREIMSGVIAIVVLVIGAILIYTGHDGFMQALMGAVVGFYFGQFVTVPTEGNK